TWLVHQGRGYCVMWFCRLLAVILAAAALAGCVRQGPPLVLAQDFDTPYTLDSGDKLRVVVFGQEGLNSTYAVDTSGKITMPLTYAVRPGDTIVVCERWF